MKYIQRPINALWFYGSNFTAQGLPKCFGHSCDNLRGGENKNTNIIDIDIDIDIFVNCNWVVTRWQQYSTRLHTNNTQNDTKQTIHRTTQQFWKSEGRAPSWRVIPWHLSYN